MPPAACKAEQTFTVVLKLDTSYAGTSLSNTATFATRATPHGNSANDSSTATVSVSKSPPLSATLFPYTTLFRSGANESYTITVHNNGPSNAGAYTVTDALPAGTSYVSGS